MELCWVNGKWEDEDESEQPAVTRNEAQLWATGWVRTESNWCLLTLPVWLLIAGDHLLHQRGVKLDM
jgi:hypothetical protein